MLTLITDVKHAMCYFQMFSDIYLHLLCSPQAPLSSTLVFESFLLLPSLLLLSCKTRQVFFVLCLKHRKMVVFN